MKKKNTYLWCGLKAIGSLYIVMLAPVAPVDFMKLGASVHYLHSVHMAFGPGHPCFDILKSTADGAVRNGRWLPDYIHDKGIQSKYKR